MVKGNFRALIEVCLGGKVISKTSRLLSKSGYIYRKDGLISASLYGDNIGITAHIRHNFKTGKDEIQVIRTGGSNAMTKSEIIADFSE